MLHIYNILMLWACHKKFQDLYQKLIWIETYTAMLEIQSTALVLVRS